MRDTVRRSGVGPDGHVTIEPGRGRSTVIVPKGFAQDWLAHRKERAKEQLKRKSLASRIFAACAGYVLVACVLVLVAAPFSIFVPESLGRRLHLIWLTYAFFAATAILTLAGWWMSHSWQKEERRRWAEEKEQRRRATGLR